MRQNKFRLLAFLFMLIALLTLTACKDDSKLEVVGIEITSNPSKVTYIVGDEFDPTGMVVSKVMEDDSKEAITDYEIDKTGSLTAKDTKVTITYEGFTATVDITVELPSLVDVEFAVDEGTTYQRTMDFSDFVKYRGVFNNETYSAWTYVTREDIKEFRIEGENLVVDVEIEFNNKTYTDELSIPIDDNYISISELKTKEIDNEIHYVEGIIVAIGTTMSRLEYILWDKDSGEYIGVAKLAASGGVTSYDLDTNGLEIGDLIRIPVKLVRANERVELSDSTKLYADYVGGGVHSTAVVSKGHQHEYNKANAITISSQEDLVDFLSHNNRVNNFYQVVRFYGQMNYAYYSGAQAYRFFFDDSIKSLSAQRIDNVSPVFINSNNYYTTGKKAVELLFGKDEGYAPTFANPAKTQKEIYAMFMGGNTYYHQFIILNENDVKDVEPQEVETKLVEPTTLIYPILSELDLTGGKVVVKYDFGPDFEEDLTLAMLDETTLPNMNVPGEYTVKGSYEGFEFAFVVEVIDKEAESLVLNGTLNKAVFNHRDAMFEEVLAQLVEMDLTVHFKDGTTNVISINEGMVTLEDGWKLGDNTVRISFLDKHFDLTVEVQSTAISVSEFLTKEADEAYDVHGIIVGPASSAGFIELLLMDITTGEIVGISNSGVAGGTSAPALDADYVSEGDEVIVRMEVKVQTTGVNVGKKRGNAVGNATNNFRENILVVSTGNELNIGIEDLLALGVEITTISTQDDLVNFIQNPDRFYSIVKLEAPIRGVPYGTNYMRFFFDENISNLAGQKISADGQSASPAIHLPTSNYNTNQDIGSLFVATAEETKYTTPAISTHTMYAIFMGGNNYYHVFNILDPSWIVNAE